MIIFGSVASRSSSNSFGRCFLNIMIKILLVKKARRLKPHRISTPIKALEMKVKRMKLAMIMRINAVYPRWPIAISMEFLKLSFMVLTNFACTGKIYIRMNE